MASRCISFKAWPAATSVDITYRCSLGGKHQSGRTEYGCFLPPPCVAGLRRGAHRSLGAHHQQLWTNSTVHTADSGSVWQQHRQQWRRSDFVGSPAVISRRVVSPRSLISLTVRCCTEPKTRPSCSVGTTQLNQRMREPTAQQGKHAPRPHRFEDKLQLHWRTLHHL